MRPPDDVLAEFKREWMAGTQPDIATFAEQVPHDQRDGFVDLVDTWLALAPDVELPAGAYAARVAGDPSLAALVAAYDAPPGSLAALVPRLRTARRWSVAELADAFVRRLALPASSAGKVSGYLEDVERGAHDPAALSRRALDALGELLGVGADALARAATPTGAPAAADGARFRAAGDTDDTAAQLHRLAGALRTPAPPEWDAVDELFCAGS